MMDDHPDAAAPAADPPAFVAAVEAGATVLTTRAGGEAMTWRVWGTGEPLVLLHGGYGSWTHWIRNVEALARDYRVLVPDMPGYGDSPLPADVRTMADFARIVAAGLDQAIPEGQAYRLAGFSFGCSVAIHLLRFHQARISRLVIVGTSGLGPRREMRKDLRHWRGLSSAAARRDAHRHNLGVVMIHDKARIDPLAVHLQSRNAERAQTRHGTLKASGDRKQMMLDHPVPLAGLWGAKDAMSGDFLDQRAAALREIDPRCSVAIIPGAGHWVQYEAWRDFNDTLPGLLLA